MKVILYTPHAEIEHEVETISKLMEEGVDYFYIRKPALDDFSLVDYMEALPEKYWKQCISTSLIITKEFDLGGYHFTRDAISKNTQYNEMILQWLKDKKKVSSVSAHSIEELGKYSVKFDHVIVSPLFPSISKQNTAAEWDHREIREMNAAPHNSSHLAVGGIDHSKIAQVKEMQFDGVGLLGAIWSEPSRAVENFIEIKRRITEE